LVEFKLFNRFRMHAAARGSQRALLAPTPSEETPLHRPVGKQAECARAIPMGARRTRL